MLPPIFKLLNIPAVQAFVGTAPARIFDFGIAPQGVVTPYIVFNQTAHEPHEQISGAPLSDKDTVQIDIYDNDRARVRKLSHAIQAACDDAGHSNRLIIQDFEKDTGLYRVSFEVDFISAR